MMESISLLTSLVRSDDNDNGDDGDDSDEVNGGDDECGSDCGGVIVEPSLRFWNCVRSVVVMWW